MNKPVAWRKHLDTGIYMYQEYFFGNAEPLYTHPVKVNYEFNSSQLKQLTDEQLIKEVRKRGYKIRNAEIVKELTDEEILEICDLGEWHKDEFAINFARAILRKAQEK